MMKQLLTITFFLFLNSLFGQNTISGIWIGKNLEYFSVNDSLVSIEIRTSIDKFQYRIENNQLILKNTYEISSGTRDSIYYVADSTLYYFNYQLINDDSLQLTLNKIIGLNIAHPREQYNYKRKSALKNAGINFQSVFFSSTTCFGTCPQMKIQIDSLGNAKFRGVKYTKPFIGNYIGKLTSEQLESLIKILNHSELDRFPNKLPYAIDAPTHNFIFRYNDKVKKSSGSIIPYFNREILIYLLNIYKKIEWERVDYEIGFNE